MLTLGNKLTLNSQPIYKFVNKYSIDFDGVDDRIVTDGEVVQYEHATYSFWCKASVTATNRGIFGNGDVTQGSFNFNWSADRPLLYLGNSYYQTWDDTSAQDDGEWHHWVVYVCKSDITKSKLWVDAVLINKNFGDNSGSVSTYTESLTIGSDRQVGGNSFEGKIDEFAVYDRELTQAEITRMYNTYYSPNRVANGNFSQIGNEEVTNGDFSQEGSEEVTNGDFATDSDWIKGTGYTINNNKAIATNTTNSSLLYQSKTYSIGIYKVVANINITDGSLRFQIGGGFISETFTTSGEKVFYIKVTSQQGYFGVATQTDNSNFTIDNVSVKEVGQDWSFGTSWSMGDGKAVATSGTGSKLTQNISGLSGKSVEVTFTLSDVSGGGVIVDFGSTNTSTISTNGTHTVYGTYDINQFELYKNGSFTGSVDNISVKEVGQHWAAESGVTFQPIDGIATIISNGSFTGINQDTSINFGNTYRVTIEHKNTTADFRVYVGNQAFDTISTASDFTTSVVDIVAVGTSQTVFILPSQAAQTIQVKSIVVQELKHDATNLMLNAGDYQSANPLITSTKSMEFDGVDNYLIANSTLGSFTGSFSCWIIRDNNSSYDYILDTRGASSGGTGYIYLNTGDNTLVVSSGTRYVDGVAATEVPADGRWHNVVVTGISLNINEDIRFGVSDSISHEFDGKMTEAGVWNRTLTALEVASLYNQGMPTNLLVNRNNYQSGNPTVFNTKQVDFDGTDDHLKANSTLGSFTGSITSWVKRNSVASVWRYITDFRANSGGGYFAINNSHNIDVPSGTVYVDNVATTVVPQDTEWHHIVVTGITLNITESIIFGSRYNIVDVFDGDISQIGLWNSTLTADEVSSLYNHGLPIDLSTDQAAYASSSNLVGYWRMGSGTLDSYPLIADQTNATLGSELVTNGDFSNGSTDWQLLNTTIENGLANFTDNGLTKYIVQNSVFNVGDVFQLTFTVNRTSGTLQVLSGVGGSSISTVPNITESGTYTFNFKNTTNGEKLFFFTTGAQNFVGTIDNVSAKKVNGNPAIMTNQTSSDIENGSPYAELVNNGTFDTDSGWTKGTGVTISNGVATSDGTSGNYDNILVGTISGTWNTSLYYVVSVEVKSYTSGNFKLNNATHNITDAISSAGTHTVIWQPSNANSVIGVQNSGTPFNGTIDNISVKEQNTGLQGYWKMGDGTNDEYPAIYDQVNPTLSSDLVTGANSATTVAGAYTDVATNWSATIGDILAVTFTLDGDYRLKLWAWTYYDPINSSIEYNTGTHTAYITVSQTVTYANAGLRFNNLQTSTVGGTISNITVKKVNGNLAYMTNMLEGNITNQYPLTKIRNYYRMGDGILDGYPIIQDQTSPNLAHIPTTNLVPNSNTFSSVSSTLTPNYGISPDGSQNSTRVQASGTNSGIRITISDSSNNAYAYSVFVKGISGETVNVRVETSPYSLLTQYNFELNGEWQRIESVLTASNTHTQKNFYVTKLGSSTATDFQVYGSQIEKQSQATAYIKSDGIAAVRKSSTTNLITYSEDFSQSYWTKLNLTASGGFLSPNGTLDAFKLTETTANNVHAFYNTTFIINNGDVYTISLFVKYNGRQWFRLWGQFGSSNKEAYFDIVNGTLGHKDSGTVSAIENYGNGWYRISATATSDGTVGRYRGYIAEADNDSFYAGDGTSGVFIWGAQYELQTQAETYAKTTGLPVTIDLFTENNYGTMTNMSASDIVEDTP